MATLIARIAESMLRQYDEVNQLVVYENPSPALFGKLNEGGNAIFICTRFILVGEFQNEVNNQELHFHNVSRYEITNGDLLRLRAFNPEENCRTKANFDAYIQSQQVDITELGRQIVNRELISFYVTTGTARASLVPILKDGDRICLLNNEGLLSSIEVFEGGSFNPANFQNNLFGAKDRSLTDLLSVHRAAKRRDAKRSISNNEKTVTEIINSVTAGSYYSFKGFSQYYDIVHNKTKYGNGGGGTGNYPPGLVPGNPNQYNFNSLFPLNSILYGPPGTGKTFHSISHALAIIEGRNIKDVYRECKTAPGRAGVKARYDRLVDEGRIVFTSFHQSLSYEDFIEGIKPQKPREEDEFLKYKIKKGIFRAICDEARDAMMVCLASDNDDLDDPETEEEAAEPVQPVAPDQGMNTGFEQRYNDYISHIQQVIAQQQSYTILSKNRQSIFKINLTNGEIYVTGDTINNRPQRVGKEALSSLDVNIPNHHIRNIGAVIRQYTGGYASIKWAVLNDFREFTGNTAAAVQENGVAAGNNEELLQLTTENNNQSNLECPKFVLIIDEINRGNVSQIFGELITLMEEDKREGAKEALTVTLPYSKKEFSIPPNLYIIGTMNTADRSVEALDTALRRRFSFIPMMPDTESLPENIDGVNLRSLLTAINKRLKILKDNDHTIGHAWLWNVNSFEKLKSIFADKIIPLLQEYFYSDYEKIGLVLGERFIEEDIVAEEGSFATFPAGILVRNQYYNRRIYKIKDKDNWEQRDFTSIYQ